MQGVGFRLCVCTGCDRHAHQHLAKSTARAASNGWKHRRRRACCTHASLRSHMTYTILGTCACASACACVMIVSWQRVCVNIRACAHASTDQQGRARTTHIHAQRQTMHHMPSSRRTNLGLPILRRLQRRRIPNRVEGLGFRVQGFGSGFLGFTYRPPPPGAPVWTPHESPICNAPPPAQSHTPRRPARRNCCRAAFCAPRKMREWRAHRASP